MISDEIGLDEESQKMRGIANFSSDYETPKLDMEAIKPILKKKLSIEVRDGRIDRKRKGTDLFK